MYNEIEYWAERLKNEGTVNTTTSSGALCEAEERLIRKYIEPYSHVLDYGIGGGRTIPLFAELHLKATGFDIANFGELINIKLQSLPEKYRYFTYVCIPALGKLPYPDRQFDAVVSFSVLTHSRPENVRQTLSEIVRLGKIAIVSAYDDLPIAFDNNSYCFSHNYNALFIEQGLKILETEKVNKMRFWVLEKNK